MFKYINETEKKIIARLYIVAMFVVIPLYNRGTFDSLSQRKVEAFYGISIVTLALYCIISLVNDIKGKDRDKEVEKTGFYGIDIAMIAYVLSVVLSFIFSSYRKEALYGVSGFGMGLLTIVVMVLSYFLISRYFSCNDGLFYFIIISSIPVVTLAIINRLGYDPIHLYPEGADTKTHLYVSTFGNYSVFSEYLTLIIPVVMCMMIISKSLVYKAFYGVYLFVIIWAIRMAGTGMVYLSVAAVIVFLVLNMVKNKNRATDIIIITSSILLLIAYAVFIILGSRIDSFANDRGYIWRLSIDMYKSFSPIKKFFGIGPNCYMYAFDDYLALHPDIVGEVNERFKYLALTSAHSELFDCLINNGLLGLISYIAVIGTMILRFFRSDNRSTVSVICMACIVSYLTYTLVNFSVICATPYFYILMGVLNSELKKTL